mmetsp:Transcript_40250/g.78694  ORF Transcript_40250/g.78694 Transcript_40250/m.78694 type:complete len:88 (-) Transcript_40250:3744-4007(-)
MQKRESEMKMSCEEERRIGKNVAALTTGKEKRRKELYLVGGASVNGKTLQRAKSQLQNRRYAFRVPHTPPKSNKNWEAWVMSRLPPL